MLMCVLYGDSCVFVFVGRLVFIELYGCRSCIGEVRRCIGGVDLLNLGFGECGIFEKVVFLGFKRDVGVGVRGVRVFGGVIFEVERSVWVWFLGVVVGGLVVWM